MGVVDEGAECEWQEKRLKVLAGSLTSFLKSFQLNALLYLSLSNKLHSPNNLLLEVIGNFLNNTASSVSSTKLEIAGMFHHFPQNRIPEKEDKGSILHFKNLTQDPACNHSERRTRANFLEIFGILIHFNSVVVRVKLITHIFSSNTNAGWKEENALCLRENRMFYVVSNLNLGSAALKYLLNRGSAFENFFKRVSYTQSYLNLDYKCHTKTYPASPILSMI